LEIYLVLEMDYEGAAWGASRVSAAFTKEEDAKTYSDGWIPNSWVETFVLDDKLPAPVQ